MYEKFRDFLYWFAIIRNSIHATVNVGNRTFFYSLQHKNFSVALLAVFGYGENVLWWLHCCEPLRKAEETEIKTDYQKFSVMQFSSIMRVL